MPFPESESLSPNRDGSPGNAQLGVAFHHSELGFEETIAWMLDPGSKVSYHCLIGGDGGRRSLVPDGEIAWHAGESSFLGRTRCNDFLLGVAFAGDTYCVPLTEAQIASALEWLGARWERLGWSLERVSDHRQIAPGRKRDLNPVEWARLRSAIAARFGESFRIENPAGRDHNHPAASAS